MNSNDLMDFNNERQHVINGLIAYCLEHELDYSYTEKAFSIKLPYIEPQATEVEKNAIINGRRKHFNTENWGPKGFDETAPDEALPDDFQMPDTGEILEEGEPPKGDKDAEL